MENGRWSCRTFGEPTQVTLSYLIRDHDTKIRRHDKQTADKQTAVYHLHEVFALYRSLLYNNTLDISILCDLVTFDTLSYCSYCSL